MGARFSTATTLLLVAASSVRTMVPTWNPLDPVGSFFEDLAKALREWYAVLLQSIVDLVSTVSIPTPEMLVNDFFSLALGGTYGLARLLVALVAVVVAFIIIITPTVRHGVKIQRALTSLLMVILMGWLFYPLYSLGYNLSRGAVEGAKALVKTEGDETPYDTVIRQFDVVNLADSISTIVATGISGVFGIFLIGTAVGLYVTTIMVLIFYPLAIAVRPLGAFGNTVFNLFNAAILTTLISPPIMVFTFMAPLLTQKYMPIAALLASPFFAIIGSLAALITPYVVFFLAFKKSSEVFGRLDDASGRFDVGEMPPVTVDQVKEDVKVTNNMSTTAMVADVMTDSLLYGGSKGDLFDDMLKKGVDLAATATTAAGHPYIGVGLKAAGGMYSNVRDNSRTDNDDGSTATPEGGTSRVE